MHEEIDRAVAQIDPLNALLFQSCWDTVKHNIYNCVKAFEEGASIQYLNNTSITLIPNCQPAETVNNYRPIILCNVTYKIISKLNYNQSPTTFTP